MTTPFHAKYWAHALSLAAPLDGARGLARSIGSSRVELNPHQVEAALFALRSPFSRGVLLADEVGLGKTIEAGLVLAQKWAERKRRLLLIVPATLRKQWQSELSDKFFLPSLLLEAKTANQLIKDGAENPFRVDGRIVICSYQYAFTKRALIKKLDWDLVVMDEAHRLRSIYKETKTAVGIVESLRDSKKLLLTATPLQNTLLELYGLMSIVDPQLFGSQETFEAQFMDGDPEARNVALRDRLQRASKRTLRRQVVEHVSFTERYTITADFTPTPAEQQLYDEVSNYLQRTVIAALPSARRKLMTMVLRKLLASSSAAIGATLTKFVNRLQEENASTEPVESALGKDFETLDETEEEWDAEAATDADDPARILTPNEVRAEVFDLKRFVELASSIPKDAKADALVAVLPGAFAQAQAKGASRKAVIFTESCKTQELLFKLLTEAGYSGQIVLINGSNNDEGSKRTYAAFKERHKEHWADVTSGSKSADMKAAIVEEFRDRGTLLLATESAAEGVNLQFCSIVVNYDLPWNPQRIEQRIGRCHRYGQKSDVLVVNFLNRKNEADRRVFELLDQKFQLFKGVFGASDEVLGAVENGVDLERRIADIYQQCRSTEDVIAAFESLQRDLGEQIQESKEMARRVVLENFDADVHKQLRIHKDTAKASLDERQQMLLDFARVALQGRAVFDPDHPRFRLPVSPGEPEQQFDLRWQEAESSGATFFRANLDLVEALLSGARQSSTPAAEIRFAWQASASALDSYRGRSGWLSVRKLSVEAIDRTQETLIVAACDEDGTPIEPDVAVKLFSLRGEVGSVITEAPPAVLERWHGALKDRWLSDLAGKDQSFFEEEREKIERRTDDLKLGLERELARLEKEIDAKTREVRRLKTFAEKVDAHKALTALKARRDVKRRAVFAEQDRIKDEEEELIDRVEKQLDEKKIAEEQVFTLRWRL